MEHARLAQAAEEALGHPSAEDHLAPCLVDREVGARVGEDVGLRVLDRHRPADHRGDGVGEGEEVAHRHAVDERTRRHGRAAGDAQQRVQLPPGDRRRRGQQGDAGPRRRLDELGGGVVGELEDHRGRSRCTGFLDEADRFAGPRGDADAEDDVARLHAALLELIEQHRHADFDVEPARRGDDGQDLLAQVREDRAERAGVVVWLSCVRAGHRSSVARLAAGA